MQIEVDERVLELILYNLSISRNIPNDWESGYRWGQIEPTYKNWSDALNKEDSESVF
jgi:hypothetical protein